MSHKIVAKFRAPAGGVLPPGFSEKKYYYIEFQNTPGTYKVVGIDRLFIIKAKLRKLKYKVKNLCGKFNKDILQTVKL